MINFHKSVLINEVIQFLNVEKNKFYIDATLGDGGHSLEIIKKGGIVFGIDVDEEAIKRAKKRFEDLKVPNQNYKLIKCNFKELKKFIKIKASGIVFDLGVSSYQLQSSERGFSFNFEGPLDMRMDKNLALRACDLLNVLNKGELKMLFSKYGEFSDGRVLDEIISFRNKKLFSSTRELSDLVEKVVGRHSRIHPATLIFQALRIAVNDDLNNLRVGLVEGFDLLLKGGKIVVISFHSLEDRIVKETFRDFEEKKLGKSLKEIVVPTKKEIEANPRSRSAKLRVFEKNV